VKVDGSHVRRGLAHGTQDAARSFWSRPPANLETQLGYPDVVHANNFFCPTTLRKARLVYTLYDLSFLEHPEWTTEANRSGCFDGVLNASLYADRIIATSEYSRRHFLETFPHYPSERLAVVPPATRFARRGDLARPPLSSPSFARAVLAERGHLGAAQEPATAAPSLCQAQGARGPDLALGPGRRPGLVDGRLRGAGGRARTWRGRDGDGDT
jgi:hypothetical protein